MCTFAKHAGFHAETETQGLIPNSGEKPGDVVVFGIKGINQISAFDVTIRDTLQHSTLPIAANSSGHLVRVGFKAKMDKFQSICAEVPNLSFLPLVWESCGGSSSSVNDTLQSWSKLIV